MAPIKSLEKPRPEFSELPLAPTDPPASAWGLWGDQDELGTLNLLTPDVIRRAAKEVASGETIPLKYE
jgi:hypothetical protein